MPPARWPRGAWHGGALPLALPAAALAAAPPAGGAADDDSVFSGKSLTLFICCMVLVCIVAAGLVAFLVVCCRERPDAAGQGADRAGRRRRDLAVPTRYQDCAPRKSAPSQFEDAMKSSPPSQLPTFSPCKSPPPRYKNRSLTWSPPPQMKEAPSYPPVPPGECATRDPDLGTHRRSLTPARPKPAVRLQDREGFGVSPTSPHLQKGIGGSTVEECGTPAAQCEQAYLPAPAKGLSPSPPPATNSPYLGTPKSPKAVPRTAPPPALPNCGTGPEAVSAAARPALRQGDDVEVLYTGGLWRRAKVHSCGADDFVAVRWCDGSTTRVPRENVRPQVSAQVSHAPYGAPSGGSSR
eukprot:TRINITY_DN14886_c0_g1_i2.p1 TRINITY_DN14886_c0_g1~~TRINITY_DN14886_c0_g1_i2.p1  ORF type:complete len:384 (+),score=53.86 TRINITY_DN14886_c0_g1_i2:99-1154(+)